VLRQEAQRVSARLAWPRPLSVSHRGSTPAPRCHARDKPLSAGFGIGTTCRTPRSPPGQERNGNAWEQDPGETCFRDEWVRTRARLLAVQSTTLSSDVGVLHWDGQPRIAGIAGQPGHPRAYVPEVCVPGCGGGWMSVTHGVPRLRSRKERTAATGCVSRALSRRAVTGHTRCRFRRWSGPRLEFPGNSRFGQLAGMGGGHVTREPE
jgi:hypothetical protein